VTPHLIRRNALMEKAGVLFDTFSGSPVDPQRWVAVEAATHLAYLSGLTLGGRDRAPGGASQCGRGGRGGTGGVAIDRLGGLEVDSLGAATSPAVLPGTTWVAANYGGWLHVGEWHQHGPRGAGWFAGRGGRLATTTYRPDHTYTLRCASMPRTGSACSDYTRAAAFWSGSAGRPGGWCGS